MRQTSAKHGMGWGKDGFLSRLDSHKDTWETDSDFLKTGQIYILSPNPYPEESSGFEIYISYSDSTSPVYETDCGEF